MRIVADESVDGPIVRALRDDGHDVDYVAELKAGMLDPEVLALARASDAVLLTADSDFGELVYRQRRARLGVLLYRLAGLSEAEKVERVLSAVAKHGSELVGAFSVLSLRALRIRAV